MKILTVGLGKCGGRIADEFNRLNRKAKSMRGVEIVTGTLAVDTDASALSELQSIKASYRQRILVGTQENKGRGNIEINKIGAEIVKKEVDKITDAARLAKRFQETDAIVVIASGAGGTGSGGMPIVIQSMKELYKDKAVYGLVVFPLENEIQDENHFISNMASCLKSSNTVADGLFLFDNQRYVQRNTLLINNVADINQLIVEPFYNLLCAGEEKKSKYIGSKLIDAGDIIQTIKGWTVLGHGGSKLSLTRRLLKNSLNFMKKSRETDVGVKVMEEAISTLSMKCNASDGDSALYLVTAPAREISVNMLNYLGDYMKQLAPNAVIRSGDYPSRRNLINIDVILSQLNTVEKVQKIYELSVEGKEGTG